MHEEHAQLLQQRLQEEVLDRIIMIQKWTRGNLARMRFLNMRRSALVLQVCWVCGGCTMRVLCGWVGVGVCVGMHVCLHVFNVLVYDLRLSITRIGYGS